MPKTRFTGDVDIWTEGEKMRVGLSGGDLPAPVRLSAHRSTEVGQHLLGALMTGQLSKVSLRGRATLTLISNSGFALRTEDHLTTVTHTHGLIVVTAEELSVTWRTTHLLTNLVALIKAAGWEHDRLQVPAWMGARLHLVLKDEAKLNPSPHRFKMGSCSMGMTEHGSLMLSHLGCTTQDIQQALTTLAGLPDDIQPSAIIVDALAVQAGDRITADELPAGIRLLTTDQDSLSLSTKDQTLTADARSVRAVFQGMRSTYPTVWLHSGVVRTGAGQVRPASIEEMQQLLDVANSVVPDYISKYKLGVPDSDDPVVNLLREAGMPNPEYLAEQIAMISRASTDSGR